MTVLRSEDLAAMLAQAGEVVMVNGRETVGIVKRATAEMFGDEPPPLAGTEIMVSLASCDVDEAEMGANLEVKGTTYKMRRRLIVEGGAITRVFCILP